MQIIMLTHIWIIVAAAALIIYLWQTYSKLSRAGVHHLPIVPFFGNLTYALLGWEHITVHMQRLCETFPDDKIVGQYDLIAPVMVIKDIDMLKRIAVKDFEHFVDKWGFVDTRDPMFGRSLLMLKGDEWKAMRATLSPAYTSSKIRLMVPFIVEVAEEMMKVLKQKMKESANPHIDIEARDLSTRFACDVIASCAFGLKIDSQSQNNHFFNLCKEVSNINFTRVLKVLLFRAFPNVVKFFKIRLSSSKASSYFTELVLDAMKNREFDKTIRTDMINILMELKKGQLNHENNDIEDTGAVFTTLEQSTVGKKQHKKEWTEGDLVAQAAIFLLAAYDTVATAIAFLLHELALNPDVQNRLAEEIKEHDEINQGRIDFNSIQQMTYLDMVVSEGLRLWPGAPFVNRTCTKDYNAGKPHPQASKDLIIRKGTGISLPIWVIHRSPELFPNPNKFDPERFSEQNRANIKPFSYFPFGLGPRNCIGLRLGLCEVKVMLYQILREMEVYPSEKTCIPTKLSLDGFRLRIMGGFWLRLRMRS